MLLSTCFIDSNLISYIETLSKNGFSSLVLVRDNSTGKFNIKISGNIDKSDLIDFLNGNSANQTDNIPKLPFPLADLIKNPHLVYRTFSNLLYTLMKKGQSLGKVVKMSPYMYFWCFELFI